MNRARAVISLAVILGLTVSPAYGQDDNIDPRLERIATHVIKKPDKTKKELLPKDVGRIIVSRKLAAGLESFWVDLYYHPTENDSSSYMPAPEDMIAVRSGLNVLYRDIGLDGKPDETSPAHSTDEQKDTMYRRYNALLDSLDAHIPKGPLER